jgi:hypothetical protein
LGESIFYRICRGVCRFGDVQCLLASQVGNAKHCRAWVLKINEENRRPNNPLLAKFEMLIGFISGSRKVGLFHTQLSAGLEVNMVKAVTGLKPSIA